MENLTHPHFAALSGDEMPEELLEEFRIFLKQVPVGRLNKGLRKLLIDYLFFHSDGLPVDFTDLLTDLYWLHELLDYIQDGTVKSN